MVFNKRRMSLKEMQNVIGCKMHLVHVGQKNIFMVDTDNKLCEARIYFLIF